MNKIIMLTVACFTLSGANAQIFYEGFNYTVGTELSAANPAWSQTNSGDTISIVSGNQTVSGLQSPVGNQISFDGTGIDYQRTFTAVNSGTLYYSLAFRITDLTGFTTGGYFAGFGANASNFSSTLWVRPDGSNFNVGLSNNTGTATYSTTAFGLNETIFVVASFNLDTDEASIWLNPSNSNFGSPSAPTATFSGLTGTARTSLDRFFIRQDSIAKTPFITLDEIRVGTSWANVTPVPEPSTYALIGLGLIGLVALRRFKRSA